MAFSTLSTAFYLAKSGNLLSGNGAWWHYNSADAAADIQSTGYFKGVGAGGLGDGTVGVHVGDIIVNIESTAGATPGRVTLHSVVSSTANGTTSPMGSTVGFDCSVSVAATT